MPCPTPGLARELASPTKERRKPLFLRSRVQVLGSLAPTTHVSAKTRNTTPEGNAPALAGLRWPPARPPITSHLSLITHSTRSMLAQGRRLTLQHSLPVGGSRLSLCLRRGGQTLSGHQLEAEMCRSGSERRPLDGGTRRLWLRPWGP